MTKKKGNNYVVDEENGIARIELNRRNAENLWTIIDLEDLERVINFPYTWYAKYNHTNKAKLVVEGREFDIEINDPELEKLVKPPKKTGYERVEEETRVYYVGYDGEVNDLFDNRRDIVNDAYIAGNYYSDKTVAENNARADMLIRQLRRFAVKHRENELDWKPSVCKYRIQYNWKFKQLEVDSNDVWQICGVIYFDSRKTAELAIETFRDELIWYFTEYKDSL